MDFTVSNHGSIVLLKEENGQYLSDDAVVALAMTTLNNAITVREYLLQLADIGRTLERRAMLLMEEMHDANHNVGDAINKDNRVSACARRLDTALDGRDA